MYDPILMDDLKDVRNTLANALTKFAAMETGRAWDGGMTDNLDPNSRAMTMTNIQGRIDAVDSWLAGDWTEEEALALRMFVERWNAALLTIERYGYRGGVPKVELAKRPEPPPNPTGILDDLGIAGGADLPPIMPSTEHEEQPPQS